MFHPTAGTVPLNAPSRVGFISGRPSSAERRTLSDPLLKGKPRLADTLGEQLMRSASTLKVGAPMEGPGSFRSSPEGKALLAATQTPRSDADDDLVTWDVDVQPGEAMSPPLHPGSPSPPAQPAFDARVGRRRSQSVLPRQHLLARDLANAMSAPVLPSSADLLPKPAEASGDGDGEKKRATVTIALPQSRPVSAAPAFKAKRAPPAPPRPPAAWGPGDPPSVVLWAMRHPPPRHVPQSLRRPASAAAIVRSPAASSGATQQRQPQQRPPRQQATRPASASHSAQRALGVGGAESEEDAARRVLGREARRLIREGDQLRRSDAAVAADTASGGGDAEAGGGGGSGSSMGKGKGKGGRYAYAAYAALLESMLDDRSSGVAAAREERQRHANLLGEAPLRPFSDYAGGQHSAAVASAPCNPLGGGGAPPRPPPHIAALVDRSSARAAASYSSASKVGCGAGGGGGGERTTAAAAAGAAAPRTAEEERREVEKRQRAAAHYLWQAYPQVRNYYLSLFDMGRVDASDPTGERRGQSTR